MSKLGIFGGTFDPPHIGHLIVARDVLDALGLDRLLFMPARVPPHKRDRTITSADLRLAMLRVAVEGDPALEVSDLELAREGASYSVETLRRLREERPDDELFFIIGADQYAELHTWREPEEIARLARLVVIPRGDVEPGDVAPELEPEHDVVEVTRIALSSTEVRERVRQGRSIRYIVPDGVRAVVEAQALYL